MVYYTVSVPTSSWIRSLIERRIGGWSCSRNIKTWCCAMSTAYVRLVTSELRRRSDSSRVLLVRCIPRCAKFCALVRALSKVLSFADGCAGVDRSEGCGETVRSSGSRLEKSPPSKSQNKYLVVSRWLVVGWWFVYMLNSGVKLKKAYGKSMARVFEGMVFFRWETPLYFLSDNGYKIDNKLLNSTLEEYEVKHITTTWPHNSVERSNRALKTMIAAFIGNNQHKWDMHLHEFWHAVNMAVQIATRV